MTHTRSPAPPPRPTIPVLSASKADANLTPTTVMIAPPSFPVVTFAILAALVAAFAMEIVCDAGLSTNLMQPSLPTLVALGGLTHTLVVQSGEWYRLLSAPFLHVDAGHLALNAVALFVAGRTLEGLLGRAWFGAVYVIGALTGSLLSLAINPTSIVSVGASGAIMALFATMLVVSLHFPAGAIRTSLLMRALYVLVPSLLPLTSAFKGAKIDYAGHFGGAIAGGLIGFFLLEAWLQDEAWPRGRKFAAAIAIAGMVALSYPAISVLRGYQAMASLIPTAKLPQTSADMLTHAAELIAQYPQDPRPHYWRAIGLLNTNDLAGAEREARAGLANESSWHAMLSPQVGDFLRVVLAVAINKDRPDEARLIARPECANVRFGPMRKLLDGNDLCKM
jgi:rhomboid protease GluP